MALQERCGAGPCLVAQSASSALQCILAHLPDYLDIEMLQTGRLASLQSRQSVGLHQHAHRVCGAAGANRVRA
jgi:hypothetical protein